VASDSGSAVAQMLYPGAPPRLTPRSWVLAILATLAVISVLSTLGVSMLHTPAMFRDLLPASAEESGSRTLLGHARFVRGDEFLAETPTALSQARSGRNETLVVGSASPRGSRQDADVHVYAPGSVGSMFFRPLNVWFLMLGADAAVVARQWSVLAVSLFAFGLLVRLMSPSLPRAAAGGLALAAVFSPTMMWWFTTTHHLAVAFGILSSALLVVGDSRRQRAVGAIASGYVAAIGAMTTYPAFFLPVALVSALCVLPVLLRQRDRVVRVGTAAVSLAVIAGTYWSANAAGFGAVLNTVYPGNRVSSSGEDLLVRALSGPFSRFLTDDRPNGWGNQTELSSPLYLFPVAALMVSVLAVATMPRSQRSAAGSLRSVGGWFVKLSRMNPLTGAVVGLVVLFGWALGFLPTALGRLVGLGGVPGARTVMGLLVASTGIGAWLVARPSAAPASRGQTRFLVGVVAVLSLAILAEGFAIRRRVGPSFLALREIVGYSVLFVVCVLGVLLLRTPTKRSLVAAGLSLLLTFGVHPLSIGMGASSRTGVNLRKILPNNPTGGRWAAHDDARLNAVVMSSGLPTLTGVYFTPDLAFWKVLDPTGAAKRDWNRYAHVVFRFGSGANASAVPVVTAVQDDVIIVEIGLCRPELSTLGLRAIVSSSLLEGPCVARQHVAEPGSLRVAELRWSGPNN
jgi:4-amino-4-deoxy-L-arabinose transferase-like glycosyltransferase